MTARLRELVEGTRLASDEFFARCRQVHEDVLAGSEYLDGANFRCIHPDDLERLFDAYDAAFFDRGCRHALGDRRLDFRLSKRMTRVGGKTTRFRPRDGSAPFYEIAVSIPLLFDAFRDGDRPITVTGVVCRNRLEALQKIIEHEILHLVEMLIWSQSSCTARRFQTIAHNLFGHTQHTHALITPRERAFTEHGVRQGSRVRFRMDDVEYTGFVNRITRRATVLVEDGRGPRYSDGKRYSKFYVPLNLLEIVSNEIIADGERSA